MSKVCILTKIVIKTTHDVIRTNYW